METPNNTIPEDVKLILALDSVQMEDMLQDRSCTDASSGSTGYVSTINCEKFRRRCVFLQCRSFYWSVCASI